MYLVSIHALLAECDCLVIIDYDRAIVSIHALLAECDLTSIRGAMTMTVSIHALLAECDRYLDQRRIATEQFQSTHSLRSATLTSM